jgi:hypothetical protein
MSRIDAVSVTLLFVSLLIMPARSQEPKSSVRQYVTVEGTVERTDSSSRALTLRTSANTTQTINVPRELELFDELRTGDRITVRLSESVTVESVDRPGRVIVYKTADSRKVIRAVADPQLLEGLKAGDVIEITYTRERAIDLQRAR